MNFDLSVLRHLVRYNLVLFFYVGPQRGYTRTELVNYLAVPRTTIYDSLRRLMKEGMVKRVRGYRKGRTNNIGAPDSLFSLEDEFRKYLDSINFRNKSVKEL